MVILFSRDSCDFLFISQFIFLTLSSNCLLLGFICVCHVSFLYDVQVSTFLVDMYEDCNYLSEVLALSSCRRFQNGRKSRDCILCEIEESDY
jgi:hypothetical protein